MAVLSLSGVITLATIDLFSDGKLGLTAFILMIMVMWGLFVIPALL